MSDQKVGTAVWKAAKKIVLWVLVLGALGFAVLSWLENPSGEVTFAIFVAIMLFVILDQLQKIVSGLFSTNYNLRSITELLKRAEKIAGYNPTFWNPKNPSGRSSFEELVDADNQLLAKEAELVERERIVTEKEAGLDHGSASKS